MRYIMTIALCACVLSAGPAGAEGGGGSDTTAPKQTLTEFLATCDAGNAQCRDDLKFGFETAADDMGIICPPDSLAEADAVEQELTWLRNAAASDSNLARGDEIDAEFDALTALWPCQTK